MTNTQKTLLTIILACVAGYMLMHAAGFAIGVYILATMLAV